MTELAYWALATTLAIASAFDWYVTYRVTRAALRKPYITVLTFVAALEFALSIATSLFAILGIAQLWYISIGQRLIEPPIGALLLVLGVLVISVPNALFPRIVSE